MFCKHCGKEINEDAKFCQYCGGNISNEVVIQPNDTEIKKTEFLMKNEKSMLAAYLYWFFLGSTGFHRLYVETFGGCILYIILLVLTALFPPVFFISSIVWLIDGSVLWVDVKKYNTDLREQVEKTELSKVPVMNIGCLACIAYVFGMFVLYMFCHLIKNLFMAEG